MMNRKWMGRPTLEWTFMKLLKRWIWFCGNSLYVNTVRWCPVRIPVRLLSLFSSAVSSKTPNAIMFVRNLGYKSWSVHLGISCRWLTLAVHFHQSPSRVEMPWQKIASGRKHQSKQEESDFYGIWGKKSLFHLVLKVAVLRSVLVKVKQSRYTPWRRLGGEEV
jgi:hypothetical protein